MIDVKRPTPARSRLGTSAARILAPAFTGNEVSTRLDTSTLMGQPSLRALYLTYHRTVVANTTIDTRRSITATTIRHNGWKTPTTKNRINAWLSLYHPGCYVYQHNHDFYLSTPTGNYPFTGPLTIRTITDGTTETTVVNQ